MWREKLWNLSLCRGTAYPTLSLILTLPFDCCSLPENRHICNRKPAIIKLQFSSAYSPKPSAGRQTNSRAICRIRSLPSGGPNLVTTGQGSTEANFLPSTRYRILRRFFSESEYRVFILISLLLREANGVVGCLSKHAQHKLNDCQRKCTVYSDERKTVNIRKYWTQNISL